MRGCLIHGGCGRLRERANKGSERDKLAAELVHTLGKGRIWLKTQGNKMRLPLLAVRGGTVAFVATDTPIRHDCIACVAEAAIGAATAMGGVEVAAERSGSTAAPSGATGAPIDRGGSTIFIAAIAALEPVEVKDAMV